MKNRDSMISSGYYQAPGKMLPEMKPDLKKIGFDAPTGYFTTICLVPVVIIYNRLIDNPPLSWQDLTDQKWKGRIGASSPEILRKLLKFYVEALLGKDAEKFVPNVVFDGMPVDQNLKVDKGALDTAIVPLPFTRASRNKNVNMCWPKEGAICLPQVLIHKKGSLEQTLKISKYFLSDDVQRFISETGMMIPVNPDVSSPPEVEKNNLNIFWKGWDWFIEGINF
jgi:ABC-type Fe3+ transport system substrate-binding protein